MNTAKRALIIATSHQHLGSSGRPTGIWADELAVPYYRLIDAGVQVVLASPRGGPVALDPGSVKPLGQNAPLVERFLTDPVAQSLVNSTVAAMDVDVLQFDVLFFPGGHGTMWDLPSDHGVTRAVEAAWGAGLLIATVCHGAAALVSARQPDGAPVVQGKRISAFTNAEEVAVGLASVVPFALETRLRELGAHFESADNWAAFAVRDAQFITGQNPQSSEVVVQHLLEALGVGSIMAA
ncbi:MAG: type 1 glutamine amidotransferase domain-containing protein [Rhodoferax sp.]